jgi:hypothetical protein
MENIMSYRGPSGISQESVNSLEYTEGGLPVWPEIASKPKLPEPLANPDFGPLEVELESGLQYMDEKGREPKDFSHIVFERALTCLYGKDIWKWYNERVV